MTSDLPPDGVAAVRTEVIKMLGAYRATASATADLAATELQLAASSAVLLLVLGVTMALLLVTAWLLVMLAIAASIAGTAGWPLALVALGGANLVATYAVWLWIRATAPNLTFRELRALLGRNDAQPVGGRHG